MPDGMWEGWIEFVPLGGGRPVHTARETTQPNKKDTVYWASGLTAVYLEGALKRALNPLVRRTPAAAEPFFDEPAHGVTVSTPRPIVAADAVLNPFSVYEKGEILLRKELGALSVVAPGQHHPGVPSQPRADGCAEPSAGRGPG